MASAYQFIEPGAGSRTLSVTLTRNNSDGGTAAIYVQSGALLLLEDIGGT